MDGWMDGRDDWMMGCRGGWMQGRMGAGADGGKDGLSE